VKVYRGTAAEARGYLERDHSRADEYYLGETAGIAEILTVTAGGEVTGARVVDGAGYERWVRGLTAQGVAKGRVRGDRAAAAEAAGDAVDPVSGLPVEQRDPIRFCEVLVNGPKSWSLAAVLHPEIRMAYDDAQDRVVAELIRYLAQNVTTKVGKAGQQRSVQVDEVSVVAVKHYTSRAGDPHRHIHLQVNSRVLVDGVWRGLDSSAMLRMSRAINGIGHRTVLADPRFRAAVADCGYHLTGDGELRELATAVPAMSKRSAQIGRQIARYERVWRKENPDVEPTARDQRVWEARAWAAGRPKKTQPHAAADGAVVERGWLTELRELGIDVDALRVAGPVPTAGVPVTDVDPDEVAERAVRVVASGARGRSVWNVHDLRGAVEEVLAARQLIGQPRALTLFAEDCTARARVLCQSVLDDAAVPGHLRHLTSVPVLEAEEDLNGRFGVRVACGHEPGAASEIRRAQELSGTVLLAGQVEAVRALTGTGQLIVVEGPAGAAKTAALATAQRVLAARPGGGRMLVVAPSKKASIVAETETGADARTAQSLAYAHGWRWDPQGVWSRLGVGERDENGVVFRGAPEWATLRSRDLLVVDEAGMLEQDAALALLHIADRAGARVAFIGDRRQLAAVGRGGVVDMALAWDPEFVQMDSVYRFRFPDGTLDSAYADLSLRLRDGVDPAAVFDALQASGRVVVHGSERDMTVAVAAATANRHAAGVRQSVSTPTNDTAEAVNELVRDRLIAAGLVDDQTTAHGMDGLRMGRGDLVMTRRNDRDLDVANRIVWEVRRVTAAGSVELRGAWDRRQRRVVPARYVRESMQLAYASTAHAVQGETSTVGEFLCTDAANAAAVYVGLTRGREQNTFHCVAGSVDEARDRFVDALGRDRSDIGLVQATSDATGEAARYGRGSELSFADRMAAALTPHTHTRRAEEQTVTVDHAAPAAARDIGRGARL